MKLNSWLRRNVLFRLGSDSLSTQFSKHDEDNDKFIPNPERPLDVLKIEDDRSSLWGIPKSIHRGK